jgi:hypothetical protein
VADTNFDAMTPEELARERLRLYEQAIGLDALRRTLPEAGGVGLEEYGTAGLTSQQMSPEQRALDEEVARRQREYNARRDAVLAAEERLAARRRTEKAQQQVSGALGESPTTPDAGAPGEMGGPPSSMIVGGPVAAQTPTQPTGPTTKTIIASRVDPVTKKVVYETQVVPIDEPGGTYRVSAGDVDVWKKGALAENDQRLAATRAYQLAHPERTTYSPETGDPTTGFQVRAGQGGFSPSRQRPGLDKTWEEVSRTESPALQDLWLKDKQQAMAIAAQEAALQDVETRRRLQAAQAGVAERELEERKDPTVVARGRIAAYEVMRQHLGESSARSIELKLAAAKQALEAAGAPMTPQVEQMLREKYIAEIAGPDAVSRFQAALMGQEPVVAAAQARQTTPYYGG